MSMSLRVSRPSAARLLPWLYLALIWAAASAVIAVGANTAADLFAAGF